MKSDVISTSPFVREVPARALHLGKQVLTDDGWQTIRGLLMFTDADQVSVFTDERDDVHTDGWRFGLETPVQMRLTPTADEEYQRKRRERRERRRQRRLAMEAAGCPSWCVEHYDGDADGQKQRNHIGEPHSVMGVDSWTGTPIEFELWLEHRHDEDSGKTETVGMLHTSIITSDVDLTPEAMLKLSAMLSSLAHRGGRHA